MSAPGREGALSRQRKRTKRLLGRHQSSQPNPGAATTAASENETRTGPGCLLQSAGLSRSGLLRPTRDEPAPEGRRANLSKMENTVGRPERRASRTGHRRELRTGEYRQLFSERPFYVPDRLTVLTHSSDTGHHSQTLTQAHSVLPAYQTLRFMPFTHPRRKWRNARDRGRARRASLIQQTRRTRLDSYHRSARHQPPSNSGWSSDSRRSSDESFNCVGDKSLDCFQLKPAPKRDPKRREQDQQQLNHKTGPTPAAGDLEGAAEGGPPAQADSSASSMEKIRFMEVVAEVDKAVGIATSPSPSSDLLDQHTSRQTGSIITKDGQARVDSDPIAFFSPIPYNNNSNTLHDRSELKSDGDKPAWLENTPQSVGRGKLHFNVDIFKSPGEIPTTFGPAELPRSTRKPTSSDQLEELNAERWECLQQLERRATEASLEGLRKASLKGENTERSQSISSGSHDTVHPTAPLRKFSSSRQAASGRHRSKSSSYSHRWGSNESNKMEPIAGSKTKVHPTITLSYHPTEIDDHLRREKLLLRSPSVSVVPILEGVNLSNESRASSDQRPVGPRPMSKALNLSRLSDASVQTDQTDVLMPLASTNRIAPSYATPPNPDEKEVIAIPSSAVKQMVRTSNYLINRKNSSNYFFNPLIHNLQNLNYQDDLNNSNDDVTQPSLIEISLNKVDGEIGGTGPGQAVPKAPTTEKPEERETRAMGVPGVQPRLNARGSMQEGSIDSRGSWGAGRFRRLSTGDGRTAPRDKRYKYMKTHPPLPPHGPSTVLPQLGPHESTAAAPSGPHDSTAPAPSPMPKTVPARVRSASLGEAHSRHSRKLPKTPGSTTGDDFLPSPPSVQAVENQKKGGNSKTTQGYAWCPTSTTKAWNDWPEPPSHEDREAARAGRNDMCPGRMAASMGRREGQSQGEKLYRFAGVKSQSEPSLGFLSSPVCQHHPQCCLRQPRKLRKRSHLTFDLNASEPVSKATWIEIALQ
ncbi:hypothetical protein PtB15_7B510 [Puccinia triticina]|nr:hypothetical protein PtB15_7B510 [Puccinia triticina]